MITSHQNRIEQLRESFKEKMADAERWEEKVLNLLKCFRNLPMKRSMHACIYLNLFAKKLKFSPFIDRIEHIPVRCKSLENSFKQEVHIFLTFRKQSRCSASLLQWLIKPLLYP